MQNRDEAWRSEVVAMSTASYACISDVHADDLSARPSVGVVFEGNTKTETVSQMIPQMQTSRSRSPDTLKEIYLKELRKAMLLRDGEPQRGEDTRQKRGDLIGQTLSDRYVIVRKLGAGGFDEVYQAHDLKQDREVVLKIPSHSGLREEEHSPYIPGTALRGRLRQSIEQICKEEQVMAKRVLAIGVGGSGKSALTIQKERLEETYGQVPDNVVLLSLDTDSSLDVNRFAGARLNPTYESNRNPKFQQIVGLGGIGKTALAYRSITEAIGRTYSEPKSAVVFVVASVAGGTGSGMLVDVATLVRHAISRYAPWQWVSVSMIAVFPNAFASYACSIDDLTLMPNAYIALREFERLTRGGWSNRLYVVDRAGQPMDHAYDHVYLVVSVGQKSNLNDEIQDVFSTVADFIIAHISSHLTEHGIVHRDVKPANILFAPVKCKRDLAKRMEDAREPKPRDRSGVWSERRLSDTTLGTISVADLQRESQAKATIPERSSSGLKRLEGSRSTWREIADPGPWRFLMLECESVIGELGRAHLLRQTQEDRAREWFQIPWEALTNGCFDVALTPLQNVRLTADQEVVQRVKGGLWNAHLELAQQVLVDLRAQVSSAAARLRGALSTGDDEHRTAGRYWGAVVARLRDVCLAAQERQQIVEQEIIEIGWRNALAQAREWRQKAVAAKYGARRTADGRSSVVTARPWKVRSATVNARGTSDSDWNAVAVRLRDVHLAVQEAVVGRREAANRGTVEEARALWRMTICRAIMKLMGGMVQYRFSIEQEARLAARSLRDVVSVGGQNCHARERCLNSDSVFLGWTKDSLFPRACSSVASIGSQMMLRQMQYGQAV